MSSAHAPRALRPTNHSGPPPPPRRPFPRALRTRDGGHVLISCITDAQFQGACRALGLEHLIDAARFQARSAFTGVGFATGSIEALQN